MKFTKHTLLYLATKLNIKLSFKTSRLVSRVCGPRLVHTNKLTQYMHCTGNLIGIFNPTLRTFEANL
jgi:hypothetical protein